MSDITESSHVHPLTGGSPPTTYEDAQMVWLANQGGISPAVAAGDCKLAFPTLTAAQLKWFQAWAAYLATLH